MSKKAILPIREARTRIAKEKATFEIKRYFMPKSKLRPIPEDIEVSSFTIVEPEENDTNNNSKRNFKHLSKENGKNSEKELVSNAKRAKTKAIASQPEPKSKKTQSHPKNSAKPKTNLTSTSKEMAQIASKKIKKPSKDTESTGSSGSSLPEVVLYDKSKISNSIIVTNSSMMEYGFDTLQTDDDTESENEDEIHNPHWSRSKNRIRVIIKQSAIGNKVVDTLFGSKAENTISVEIFPTIKPIVRRRSTAVWNTPPRYSMLPKY
ncbi:inner centromere protein-like [Contarinia nasturtii]|uniref:inner centromere protein-like n=1 Tax=Contarinia nasturtii TaxID=265458 RepID=UPI0012D47867|nr:inner centromere protein-like [Contarinia nasturtii]XP_031627163.1 inner centromere protein-like [Contarinia nasturtii]